MNEETKHFDEDLDLRVSQKLSEDLNILFKPQFSIPPEVDRAILDKANQFFTQKHWSHHILRHINIWRIAAAAAVIIFAFSLNLTRDSGPTTSQSLLVKAGDVDIDENGLVDILDAFKLARYVESAERTEKKWDINGDGLINSNDVDLVVSAAVRLDKGVL
ncbi:MAG: dockerin type I domain-containing protein [Sedimentisphaerales bacterium]|nr:dockerin type I domain-containing protein [Sedimentisphaerales bacterium]